jgi:hypothetical protein
MNYEKYQPSQSVNKQRRQLLQGVCTVAAVTAAPVVLSKPLLGGSSAKLTGELICSISNPIKTLVLRNHSDQTMVIDQLAQGAFMYDGNVVDCNAACLSKSITIKSNQEVKLRFDSRQQAALEHAIHDYRRIQARVTRLNDGTRVIPFAATLSGNIATIA